MSEKAIELEVIPPAKVSVPAIVPKLKAGNDAAVANKLVKLFKDANNGMRRIVSLGLFAWEVKEGQLKHGEWGPWLAANAPSLSRVDSETGKPKASSALSAYMDTTKGVLENVGFPTIEKYLNESAKFPRSGNFGGFLLLQEKKVPAAMKPLREKICALVDGKTQKQLHLEFKQTEEDGDGNRKVKRGQLKGSKGLTKEQREKAAAREEQQRLNELEEAIIDKIAWLLEIADAKNLGAMDTRLIKQFCDAADTASGFGKQTLASRASTKDAAQ